MKPPSLSSLEDYTLTFLHARGQIYFKKKSYLNAYYKRGEQTQENLTENEWANACLIVQTQSINTNSKRLQKN